MQACQADRGAGAWTPSRNWCKGSVAAGQCGWRRAICDYNSVEFSELVGHTLVSVTGAAGSFASEIVFTSEDGTIFTMHHHQDCCEHVSVDDVCGDVEDLIGSPILRAEEARGGSKDVGGDTSWTFYHVVTARGAVTIRWGGSSNGYYSTSVSFCKTDPPEPEEEHWGVSRNYKFS
jgi:hypothetical protein